jgi:hypothetical protein
MEEGFDRLTRLRVEVSLMCSKGNNLSTLVSALASSNDQRDMMVEESTGTQGC